jgi:ABC-2 type transport system ATP-binding protein
VFEQWNFDRLPVVLPSSNNRSEPATSARVSDTSDASEASDLRSERGQSVEASSDASQQEQEQGQKQKRRETGATENTRPQLSVERARQRGEAARNRPVVLRTEALTKTYGTTVAVNEISFDVHEGSFTGIVGPNGAGKTTTLSMITGLNRPTSGRVTVRDIDVWSEGRSAKRVIGTLPDRLRLFDRLTGAQLLHYAGVLQGLDREVVSNRAHELATALGLGSALDRLVSDYSAGMQKKIMLACAMVHAPDVLVLDEPFETIDPVSAANVTEILEKYVAGGGSVLMSSHSLELIQRVCDHVIVIVGGESVAQGSVDEVRDGKTLEERFSDLIQDSEKGKGLEWLHGLSESV